MNNAVQTQVKASPVVKPIMQPTQGGLLQRKCACGGTPGVDGECEECRAKHLSVQRRASTPATPTSPPTVPPIVHEVLASPGQPLDAGTRAFMEPRFGHDFTRVRVHASMPKTTYTKLSINQPGDQYEQEADQVANEIMRIQDPHVIEGARGSQKKHLKHDFSKVRIHTDTQAAESARAINALAYTMGNNIVFGAGQYIPSTSTGQRLLAHELTHTLQQSQTNTYGKIMRRWDKAPECSDAPTDKWIKTVVVNQESPQTVTLHWSDDTIESDICSTGKGHCCVDPTTPDGVACSASGSRVNGSNCTPITESTGFPVRNRVRDHSGINFWTEFVPERAIALHEYDPVSGTPLSHGCVRLHTGIAQRIFCGVRQNQTNVQVHGFARPMCDDPALQKEWFEDFITAAQPTDGELVSPAQRSNILETRRELEQAFGVNQKQLLEKIKETVHDTDFLSLATPQDLKQVAAIIPRCKKKAALPTAEERLLKPESVKAANTATVPDQILASSGFDKFLVPFTTDLRSAGSLAGAQRVVRNHGRKLWQAATARAQGTSNDDRPLYWARLQMTLALRQWEPHFRLNDTQRQDLIDRFEHASRGMETATFSHNANVKKILISGFDPFALNENIRRGNPSGSAVLALNGRLISNGGVTAEVRGAIFPVRFADFDAGIVESFFRPYLTGKNSVDMIMTISMGASDAFVVEKFAGRRRSSSAPDNLGVPGGGSQTTPIVPPGVGPGDEFIETSLPTGAILGTSGGTVVIRENTEVSEIPAGGSSPVTQPGGPTPSSTAVKGSGGGYLSNEIFYRTSLLRSETGVKVPYGHLHTPLLIPGASGISSSQYDAARNAIVNQIEKILIATLPTL